MNLMPEDAMSNGPKMTLGQTMQIKQIQTIGVYLAPLMTPVLRRSRADRPELVEGDDPPWRRKVARR
jgi:hypothetical protein